MTSALETVMLELKLRNYAPKTQKGYLFEVKKFARHFDRPLEELGFDDVRKYQLSLIDQGVAWNTFNGATCALRFLYGVALKREGTVERIPYARKEKRLPMILSEAEMRKLILANAKPRYEVLLLTMYVLALRNAETRNIKVSDIDASRMVINIRGKGAKDRVLPISKKHLARLRQQWRETRSPLWLFPGKTDTKPLSERVLQNAFTRARDRAEIKKKVNVHTVRHSRATHLLEAGVDIRIIQQLLGHARIETTLLYTRVTTKALQITSAHLGQLDDLM